MIGRGVEGFGGRRVVGSGAASERGTETETGRKSSRRESPDWRLINNHSAAEFNRFNGRRMMKPPAVCISLEVSGVDANPNVWVH